MKNAIKRKELRAYLIYLLDCNYPSKLSKNIIIYKLKDEWEISEIEKELAYLVDKKYLIKTYSKFLSLKKDNKIINFKITPLGRDLIDGTIIDLGVPILFN